MRGGHKENNMQSRLKHTRGTDNDLRGSYNQPSTKSNHAMPTKHSMMVNLGRPRGHIGIQHKGGPAQPEEPMRSDDGGGMRRGEGGKVASSYTIVCLQLFVCGQYMGEMSGSDFLCG